MRHMGRRVASQPGEGEREIFEGALTLFEPEKFDGVKDNELGIHVVSSALENLPPGVMPPPGEVTRVRWAMEWEANESPGHNESMMRVVVIRYTISECDHRPTTTPTRAQISRHLVLPTMPWHGVKGDKTDVAEVRPRDCPIQHNRSSKMDPCVRELYGDARGQDSSFPGGGCRASPTPKCSTSWSWRRGASTSWR